MELTLPMALSILPHLSARDSSEIRRTQPDLEKWAMGRCMLPGMAVAIIAGGEVQAIGGVVDCNGVGTLWLAGREGWTRYVKHVLRVFREIQLAGFKRMECKAYLDNARAQRFVERLGFARIGVKGNLVHYGMTP